jgi:hypothetical protein
MFKRREKKMNKFYDIDLPFGEIYEKKLKEIFGNKKLEVKTERDIWKQTGNICIEIECRGKPSGIKTTQSDFWVQIYQENGEISMVLIFRTDVLKKKIDYFLKNKNCGLVYGGDNKESLLVLISLKDILTRGN